MKPSLWMGSWKWTIMLNKKKATLKPSSSKVKHMAKPDFFHLGVSNYVS